MTEEKFVPWYKRMVKCVKTGEVFTIPEAAEWMGCEADLIMRSTDPASGGCWGYKHEEPHKFVLI